jgi:hypothetical protein
MNHVANISAPLATLPECEIIRDYPKGNWLVIGHLTHAKATSATTQLQHFRQMMHALGYPNRVFSHRLHWLVRVGGPAGHIHLHFLLGGHQLVDGRIHSYTSAEVISFLKNAWKAHGMAVVESYDPCQRGIEYVLRREDDRCHNDVEMSDGLISGIKKIRKGNEPYYGRDPLALELVREFRTEGVRAGFGDEMLAVRRGAA